MRTAMYKGKHYRLDYLGNTRYGRRAKLSFFNGRRSFWVNADAIREIVNDTETAAERRNATIIDHGYEAYAREEGHYDIPF